MAQGVRQSETNRGVAQFGRAPRSGRGGRKFESCRLDAEKEGFPETGAFFFCPSSNFVLTFTTIFYIMH